MNARQKAKHFKRLYEETLPKKPYPVVYKTLCEHHRILAMIDARDIAYLQDNPQLLKTHIENRILQGLRPLIWDNLKTEKDKCLDKYIYSLDIWMGVDNGNDK
jgi:hypothetical protein